MAVLTTVCDVVVVVVAATSVVEALIGVDDAVVVAMNVISDDVAVSIGSGICAEPARCITKNRPVSRIRSATRCASKLRKSFMCGIGESDSCSQFGKLMFYH